MGKIALCLSFSKYTSLTVTDLWDNSISLQDHCHSKESVHILKTVVNFVNVFFFLLKAILAFTFLFLYKSYAIFIVHVKHFKLPLCIQ